VRLLSSLTRRQRREADRQACEGRAAPGHSRISPRRHTMSTQELRRRGEVLARGSPRQIALPQKQNILFKAQGRNGSCTYQAVLLQPGLRMFNQPETAQENPSPSLLPLRLLGICAASPRRPRASRAGARQHGHTPKPPIPSINSFNLHETSAEVHFWMASAKSPIPSNL